MFSTRNERALGRVSSNGRAFFFWGMDVTDIMGVGSTLLIVAGLIAVLYHIHKRRKRAKERRQASGGG